MLASVPLRAALFAALVGLTLAPASPAQPAPGSPGRPVDGYACADRGPAGVPAIERLRSALAAGDRGTSAALVRCLSEVEAPVIEAAPTPGRYLVTFPFVTDTDVEAVRLRSNVVAARADFDGDGDDFDSLARMERIADTDLWAIAIELPSGLRAPYRFEVASADGDAALALDPRNPRVYEERWTQNFRKSEMVLPDAPAQPWRARPGRDGSWEIDEVAGRELAVYVPAGAPEADGPRPVVVALGTNTFYNILPTGRLIDHLVEERAIETPIVITVDLAEGSAERRYRTEADYVADTLLPWVRARWPISSAPEDVVVAGTSRRGLVSAIAALDRPEAIGKAISLSGSFYWRPEGEDEFEWLARRLAREPRREVALHVAAGTLETAVTATNRGHPLLTTNRHLRDVLVAKGYDHVYEEFVGIHDEMSWQSALADALRALLPPR